MHHATMTALAMVILSLLSPKSIFAATNETVEAKPIICGQNEEFVECLPCPTTCQRPIPESCTQKVCVAGCKCKAGHLRDSNGDCVNIIGCLIDILKNQVSGLNLK